MVVRPEDFAGSVIGDLSLRRGRIESMEHRAGSQMITAIAPLAEMLGYATHMRSITHAGVWRELRRASKAAGEGTWVRTPSDIRSGHG